MRMEDDGILFGMGEGCLSHGDEYMRECATCGVEFCAKCFSGRVLCPDCSEGSEEDLDPEDDFDADITGVDGLLDEVDDPAGGKISDAEDDGERH